MVMRSHCISYLLVFTTAIILFGGGASAYAQYPGFDAPSIKVSGGGLAGLVPVNSKVDGGSVPVGATSQVVVLFRNEGSQPVQTGKINLYPSSNLSANVSLNQCSVEPLPSGAECAVAISVKGLQPGTWRLEMLMLHSGRSRLVTATLSGNIDASGDSSNKLSSDIEAIPSELSFGSLTSGQSIVEPVILRNITSKPVTITDIFINSSEQSGYTVETDCSELQAGEACIATVTWSPMQKGPSTGVLVVKHSGSTGLASIPLSGDYTPESVDEADIFPNAVPGKGLLVSSQSEFKFGPAISSKSTITVSLVNVGDTALTISDIKISGSDNGLSVNSDGCSLGTVLEPVEACPLSLTWSPTRVGALLDDVQILHDGARGILVLPVRGFSDTIVSQDQKAIVLSTTATRVISGSDISSKPNANNPSNPNKKVESVIAPDSVANAVSALDGLKITSFSLKHAIVNGPGGSRLISNKEQVMFGGVIWDVDIQSNGIEFANGGDRVLLLFDKSLSSLNRIAGQSYRNYKGKRGRGRGNSQGGRGGSYGSSSGGNSYGGGSYGGSSSSGSQTSSNNSNTGNFR